MLHGRAGVLEALLYAQKPFSALASETVEQLLAQVSPPLLQNFMLQVKTVIFPPIDFKDGFPPPYVSGALTNSPPNKRLKLAYIRFNLRY